MKRILFLLAIPVLLTACSQDEKINFPYPEHIVGLAGPVNLELGQTEIYLTDYFTDPMVVDSVFIAGEKVKLPPNRQRIFFKGQFGHNPMMEMEAWVKGVKYSIPVRATRKVKVTYSIDPKGKDFQSVQLAGEFNGWTPSRTELKEKDGKWVTTLYLDRGQYQYQLVVDGKQFTDPYNPDSVDNNMGGYNSILYAGEKEDGPPMILLTDEAEGEEIEVGTSHPVVEAFVFWQNFRIPSEYLEIDGNEIEFDIPERAGELEWSYIRAWAYDSAGLSNDILIPLKYGRVVMDADQLDREDFRSAIIYNVFMDRFYNGQPDNDRPLNSPEVLPPADYHGGDIEGVTQKLKDGYFDSLGVNTIWISPIVKNPEEAFGYWPEPESKFSGYHGYWPISFTEIDDRFGTPSELKELVGTTHEKGMNILLDFVANHVHEQHPVYREHPEWATDLYLPDGTLNTEKWDEYRLTTWFDVFLPTLNLELPVVTGMLSDSALWWLKTYNFDGFRHDATKHIPEIFWRTLTEKIREQLVIGEGKRIYQIGETYGSPQLISSYVGSGMLDGQFDFNVYDASLGAFARDEGSFDILHDRLLQSLDYYGGHNRMGYITGNQDRGRFISYAGGDLKFNEDAKAAGWTRDIGVGIPDAYKKLQMLMAFNMTIPGIPVIFYGDEFGMPGGNDPDNRRMMKFNGLNAREKETLGTTSRLTGLRSNHMSLIYGDFISLLQEEKTFAYARKYFDETSVVIFNKNDDTENAVIDLGGLAHDFHIESSYGGNVVLDEDRLDVTLKPLSFAIVILRN